MSIEEIIVSGKILYLNVLMPHDTQYRDKYFVVVCVEPLTLLKINTPKQQTETGLKCRKEEFKIKQSIYTFLYYNSCLDCGTLWYNLISKDEAVNQITSDEGRAKGTLLPDHKNEALRISDKSRSISPRNKRLIRECLKK